IRLRQVLRFWATGYVRTFLPIWNIRKPRNLNHLEWKSTADLHRQWSPYCIDSQRVYVRAFRQNVPTWMGLHSFRFIIGATTKADIHCLPSSMPNLRPRPDTRLANTDSQICGGARLGFGNANRLP